MYRVVHADLKCELLRVPLSATSILLFCFPIFCGELSLIQYLELTSDTDTMCTFLTLFASQKPIDLFSIGNYYIPSII